MVACKDTMRNVAGDLQTREMHSAMRSYDKAAVSFQHRQFFGCSIMLCDDFFRHVTQEVRQSQDFGSVCMQLLAKPIPLCHR